MIYTIKTHKSVDKFLSSHRDVARTFVEKFTLIAQDPTTILCDIKPLRGKSNQYRLRIGKYRFLYEIKDDQIQIWIWKADSRGSVYR